MPKARNLQSLQHDAPKAHRQDSAEATPRSARRRQTGCRQSAEGPTWTSSAVTPAREAARREGQATVGGKEPSLGTEGLGRPPTAGEVSKTNSTGIPAARVQAGRGEEQALNLAMLNQVNHPLNGAILRKAVGRADGSPQDGPNRAAPRGEK